MWVVRGLGVCGPSRTTSFLVVAKYLAVVRTMLESVNSLSCFALFTKDPEMVLFIKLEHKGPCGVIAGEEEKYLSQAFECSSVCRLHTQQNSCLSITKVFLFF